MINDISELKCGRGKPPPASPPRRGHDSGPKRPKRALDIDIDLDRLVWDPEYRDRVRRRLKRLG